MTYETSTVVAELVLLAAIIFAPGFRGYLKSSFVPLRLKVRVLCYAGASCLFRRMRSRREMAVRPG